MTASRAGALSQPRSGPRRRPASPVGALVSSPVAGVVAGLVAWALVACGVPVDDRARTVAPADLGTPATVPSDAPPVARGPGRGTAQVYFVRGSRLEPVDREVALPLADGAIEALLARPTAAERDQGLRTAVTGTARLAGTLAAGVPLVEVDEAFVQVEGEEQVLALAQIVYTLTGLPGVSGVAFALDGRTVEVPTGDGALRPGPLRRFDYVAVSPAR
ncbi:MAG: GerMN domain-containing protein [Actinomycetota bacterium]